MKNKEIIKVHRIINIFLVNKHKRIVDNENIADLICKKYDSRFICELINTIYEEFKDDLINLDSLVNYITNLDIIILRDSTALVYTLDYARVINIIDANNIKVEYTYIK